MSYNIDERREKYVAYGVDEKEVDYLFIPLSQLADPQTFLKAQAVRDRLDDLRREASAKFTEENPVTLQTGTVEAPVKASLVIDSWRKDGRR